VNKVEKNTNIVHIYNVYNLSSVSYSTQDSSSTLSTVSRSLFDVSTNHHILLRDFNLYHSFESKSFISTVTGYYEYTVWEVVSRWRIFIKNWPMICNHCTRNRLYSFDWSAHIISHLTSLCWRNSYFSIVSFVSKISRLLIAYCH
jgi:hypothetical protein